MSRWFQFVLMAQVATVTFAATASPAWAITFTTGYTGGGSWRTVYAQGFKASVSPSPDPGHAIADTVMLDRVQFFKSGVADTATNIQLAIVSNIFLDLTPGNFTTNTAITPSFVGLSTNTIADTASIATGGAITFNFNHLPLVYGADNQDELLNNNYAAVFVNNNAGVLTPVLVSTLGVDYLEGQNEIASDYGSPGNYFLSTSNFTETNTFGTFFKTFNQTDSGRYGDANFIASFDLPAGVQGDYNGNGTVDAADYVLWRNQPASLANEGASPGVVDQADYTFWRGRFGSTSGAASGVGLNAAVPEPATAVIVIWTALVWLLGTRRLLPK